MLPIDSFIWIKTSYWIIWISIRQNENIQYWNQLICLYGDWHGFVGLTIYKLAYQSAFSWRIHRNTIHVLSCVETTTTAFWIGSALHSSHVRN